MHVIDSLSFGKIVQIREQLLRAQAAGSKVFRFESGDPSFSIAPHVGEAIHKAIAEHKTHYIPNAGIPELKRAIRTKLEKKNGIRVGSDDEIFVTNGAMHAIFATFTSLLDQGDEVIVPEPMWTEIVENIRLARGVPVPVPILAANDYEYRPENVASRIGPKTKAIFLNSPHNPTGGVLGRNTLEALVKLARQHNLFLVSDEAYEDVVYDPYSHISIASLAPDLAPRIISVFSMSKSHAMSGLRVGYLVTADAKIQERLQKVLRCSINGVNSLAQWAAAAAIDGGTAHMDEMREEYAKRRDILCGALDGIPGLKVFRPHGAFYVWAELDRSLYERLGCKDADGVSAYLAKKGLGSTPGDAFGAGCADAIRFAFSCSTEMVKEGSSELRKVLTTGR